MCFFPPSVLDKQHFISQGKIPAVRTEQGKRDSSLSWVTVILNTDE